MKERIKSRKDSERFAANIAKLKSLQDNILNYQDRQSNKMPDSMILTFTLAFDCSDTKLMKILNTANRTYSFNALSNSKTSTFKKKQIEDPEALAELEQIQKYLDATKDELVISFKKGKLKSSFQLEFGAYSFSEEATINNLLLDDYLINESQEIIFPYNFYPGFNHYNLPNLMLTKFGYSNFISILDFKDSDVEVNFGDFSYSPPSYRMPKSTVKPVLKDVFVKFNPMADYISAKTFKVSKENHLSFKGRIDDFVIRSKEAKSLWFP